MDISFFTDMVVFLVNLSAKKTFKICILMLELKEFSQYEIKKSLKSGMSVVNSTFKYLEGKKIIEKKNGKYFLADPDALCLSISYFYRIQNNLVLFKETGLTKQELLSLLPKKAILCLESAFEQYSNYFQSNNVFAYLAEEDLKAFEKKLILPGNKSSLFVFKQKPLLDSNQLNQEKNCTSLLRTAIDLFCDNKAVLGSKMLRQFYELKK